MELTALQKLIVVLLLLLTGPRFAQAWLCLKSPKSFLDQVSTGSGSDLVKSWESRIVRKYRMLITDQVATAPCTNPIQVRFLLLRQSF
jgi:hypothetical protein